MIHPQKKGKFLRRDFYFLSGREIFDECKGLKCILKEN